MKNELKSSPVQQNKKIPIKVKVLQSEKEALIVKFN